jgi:hypothetical protein
MIRVCKGAFSGQVLLSSIERAHSFERARLSCLLALNAHIREGITFASGASPSLQAPSTLT